MSQLKYNDPCLSVQMSRNKAAGCAESHEGLYKQDEHRIYLLNYKTFEIKWGTSNN